MVFVAGGYRYYVQYMPCELSDGVIMGTDEEHHAEPTHRIHLKKENAQVFSGAKLWYFGVSPSFIHFPHPSSGYRQKDETKEKKKEKTKTTPIPLTSEEKRKKEKPRSDWQTFLCQIGLISAEIRARATPPAVHFPGFP